MRQFISTLTSLLFASHVLLGCCAYHAHGHSGMAAGEQASYGDDHHGASHGHGEQDGPADDEDCPAPCCGQSRCSYVKAEVTRIDRGDVESACSMVALLANAQPIVGISSATRDVCQPFRRSDPPLHLLYCALLI